MHNKKRPNKNNRNRNKDKKPWKTVNILDLTEKQEEFDRLEPVRISGDDVFLCLFTPEGSQDYLHWIGDPELRGYVHCNGDDCLLCKIGNRKVMRFSLPVYSFETNRIALLSMSDSMRPHALLPQITNILESNENLHKHLVLISKDSENNFQVRTQKLPIDKRHEIKRKARHFKAMVDDGEIDLDRTFQRLSNDQLKTLSSVHQKLELLAD